MLKNNTTVENRTYHKNSIVRIGLAVLAVMLQVALFIFMISYFGKNATWIEFTIQILAFFLVLKLYAEEKTSAMKMPWIILILVLPVVGVTLYYLIGGNIGSFFMRKKYKKIDTAILEHRMDDAKLLEEIKGEDIAEYGVARYISDCSGYPIYKNTKLEYFGDTSEALERQIADIYKAEKYVFMEYFAIENSLIWNRVADALEDRAKAGVEVRILYDDVGSIGYVGADFAKIMQERGLKCHIFNPVKAVFNMFMNNRDHRKITVIDGKVGYTGGYNMADEYFNVTHPYGRWKDSGLRLDGSAVNSLTAAFLEMWNASIRNEKERDADYSVFFDTGENDCGSENSFVQPYGDSPMDNVRVGEDVYLSMIESAREYCYFMTPYLIITEEMVRAMTLAAKRGVDVRIVVPGIPDKKVIYSVTRSFYNGLVTGGVKVFEWIPGFVHAKLSIADGKMATCGSINLDYRSLYHHFEFGCFFIDDKAVKDIYKDFEAVFAECREVSDKYRSPKYRKRIGQLLLRLFAELM